VGQSPGNLVVGKSFSESEIYHAQSKDDTMGLFSKDIQTMDDLLLHGLKDIYYAENQIVKALPSLIDKATNRSRKA
jgi:D-serine deaminase-like pyridoxal phosphate-dependent protein